jgi:hypothetical protein
MSEVSVIIEVSGKEVQMANSRYSLYTYEMNGQQVVSAIHIYDLGKFLREHPDAMLVKK